MKTPFLPLVLLAFAPWGKAEEVGTKWDVDVPAVTPAEPVAEASPALALQIVSSQTKSVELVSGSTEDGSSQESRTVNVSVQMVADPGLQQITTSSSSHAANRPATNGQIQRQERTRGFVYVSATVYNGTRSRIRIFPGGGEEGAVEAWSNIDFNLFSGTGKMLVGQAEGASEEVTLVMSVENIDTAVEAQRAASRGSEYQVPQIPALPNIETGGASFSVIHGAAEDAGMARLEQLHDLYTNGHEKLEQAHAAVLAAREARQARLQANPPPTDVKISVWSRGPQTTLTTNQEGGER